MNLADSIFISLALIAFCLLVVPDFRYTWRKRASENWPTMEATIESAVVRRGGPALAPILFMYRVFFTYSYSVNGIQYSGLFVLIADKKKSGEGLKQALTGKRIVVRYDTRHPKVSFISVIRIIGKRVMQHPHWTGGIV